MQIPVTLHVHEKVGSGDSSTPGRVLAQRYADMGFGAVGFVGHDEQVSVEHPDIVTFSGIEHELRKSDKLHVVEFPAWDFSFLAHPRLTFGSEDAWQKAHQIAFEQGLDGIEKFNRGMKQFDRDTHDSLVVLANDDAHNTHQAGASYMVADAVDDSPKAIMNAIKSGNVELHNPGLSTRRHLSGRLHQGLSLLR